MTVSSNQSIVHIDTLRESHAFVRTLPRLDARIQCHLGWCCLHCVRDSFQVSSIIHIGSVDASDRYTPSARSRHRQMVTGFWNDLRARQHLRTCQCDYSAAAQGTWHHSPTAVVLSKGIDAVVESSQPTLSGMLVDTLGVTTLTIVVRALLHNYSAISWPEVLGATTGCGFGAPRRIGVVA